MSSEHDFKLNLPGLLQVLAEHLYADRRVGVRELLQNAHDSCSRRQIESSDDRYQPRIEIRIDQQQYVLEIEDNGSGLTENEIDEYLTTIGRGYTRHLRESHAFNDTQGLDQLIGQFGLGFLSAFLIAESVELETLSSKPESNPILWRSQGDGSYTMEEGHRTEIGTLIRLTCKPSMRHLLNERALAELVTHYCDLLPHPITIEQHQTPANRGLAPWDGDNFERDMYDFLESRGISRPLWMVPLRDWKLELNLDSIHVPLRGVLFIPQGSIASLHEFGDATVYIRNMFICNNHRTLLPRWAKFVRAIVSSPTLQPTASRESIHEDEGFEIVSQAIEQQLLAALDELSRQQGDTWNTIVKSHKDLIIGWATSNDEFFDRLVDRIELETSSGRLTIKQCLNGTDTIYCRTQTRMSPAERILANGHDHPVVDASWFGVKPFLGRYLESHPEVNLVECDDMLEAFVTRTPGRHFQALLDRLEDQGIAERVVTADFEPRHLSAVLAWPADAEVLRDARQAIEENDLIPGIADILPDWIQQKEDTVADLNGILYLNTRSPLILELNQIAQNGELSDAPLTLLIQMTRLICQTRVNPDESVASLVRFNEALLKLMAK